MGLGLNISHPFGAGVLPLLLFARLRRRFKTPAPPTMQREPPESQNRPGTAPITAVVSWRGLSCHLQDGDFGALPVDDPPRGHEGFCLRAAARGGAGAVKTRAGGTEKLL